MPNKIYANEWLNLSEKNLETARLLLRENHFTDIIAIEIHQTIEKAFKAVLAFHGLKIQRTHSLPFLYNLINPFLLLPDVTLEELVVISDYYETEKYPGPNYFVPNRSEIENQFLTTEKIYKTIKLHINKID